MLYFHSLSLLSCFISIGFGVYVYAQDTGAKLNRVFFALCLVFAYWAIAEYGYRGAKAAETATFWLLFGSFWPLAASIFLHFAILFCGYGAVLASPLSLIFIYLPSVALSVLLLENRLTKVPVLEYWGWTAGAADKTLIFNGSCYAVLFIVLIALGLFLKNFIRETLPWKRRASLLMLIGVSVPVLAGVLTELILPGVGILFPELTCIACIFSACMLGYAILYDNTFALTPKTAANSIINTMSDGLIVTGANGRIQLTNPALLKMLDCGESQLVSMPVESIFAKDKAHVNCGWEKAFRNGDLKEIDMTIKRFTGETISVSLSISVVIGKNGKDLGRIYICRDISSRKLAEEALHASEERFRSYVENANDLIYTLTVDGAVSYISPRWTTETGFDLSEIMDKQLTAIIHPDDRNAYQRYLTSVLNGECETSPEYRIRRKDGEWEWYFSRVVLIKNPEGEPRFLGVARNITQDRKNRREREGLLKNLANSRKMEALGLLLGGVAHDLNNVLGVILGIPDLLLMKLPEDSSSKKHLLAIRKSGEKAAAIIDDLLTLTRRGVVSKEVVDLNEIIHDYMESPQYANLRAFHPKIQFSMDLEKNPVRMKGSSIHLMKTLMNLVSNAAEAIPEVGNVLISTKNQTIEPGLEDSHGPVPGDYVVLQVKDNGTGISPEDKERIFEPFYTKKTMGRSGTGLGMAVVWGTVHDLEGHINIHSTEGKGTTFELFFPATGEEMVQKVRLPMKDYFGNEQWVLVVDDVPEQCEITVQMMKALRYRVKAVSSLEDAMAYLRDHAVDILIFHVTMDSGMDEVQTFRQITGLCPDAKTVAISSRLQEERVRKLQKLGLKAVINKPFTMKQIGSAVKNA